MSGPVSYSGSPLLGESGEGGFYKNTGVELFKHDRKSADGGALGEEAAPEVWGLGERAIKYQCSQTAGKQ